MLSTLHALCGGNRSQLSQRTPVTFPSQRAGNTKLCFLCCWPKQAVEQIFVLPAISNTMTDMWCYCNVTERYRCEMKNPSITTMRRTTSLKDFVWLRHDDVIKWKHFTRYWPFVRGIHRSPVNSSHKGQWREALMFPLICVWINDWVNNCEAGDLRRHRGHYDVIVIVIWPMDCVMWFCVASYSHSSQQSSEPCFNLKTIFPGMGFPL